MAGWDAKATVQEVQNVKIGIMIPHRDEHDIRQWRMWYDQKLQKPPGTQWWEQRGFSLTTNRTQLVRLLLQSDCTHGFFLDDDVICPDDILIHLLQMNLPIACGLYMAKKKLSERGLAAWLKVEGKGYAPIDIKQPGRYVEVDVTGLGCALIQRQVFERMPEPWFQWNPPPEPSEDFFFFEKCARELNIKPIIDMEMKCHHVGLFVLDTDGRAETPNI